MIEQAPVLIVVIPLISAFLTPLIGWGKKELCYPWVILSLALSGLCTIITFLTVIETGTIHYHMGGWLPPWGIEYVVDHLSAFVLAIISFISLTAAVYSKESVKQELSEKTVYFYTVFLLQVTGFLGIVVTGDMFNLYVFLEIASLSGYALIAVGGKGAPLAGFRYLIMGTVGASFYLLGVGYLYMATGSLNMADLAGRLPGLYDSKVILVAFTFFTVGVAIKMALFPFHGWLPDAYEKAPSSVSTLLAPLMTKVATYVMIRIIFTVFSPYFSIETLPFMAILSWIAAAAILYGAFMALAQTDLKRMLVYILVSEVGYLALGIGLANRNGFTGTVLHIMNDACMMVALFMIAGAISYRCGNIAISQFRNLHRKMPFTMGAFVVVGFSVVGIPPSCGFFSKWYLILGAVDAGQWVQAGVLVLSSLLNAILFFRVIEYAYIEPRDGQNSVKKPSTVACEEAPLSMLVPIIGFATLEILLGLLSGLIIATVINFTVPVCF